MVGFKVIRIEKVFIDYMILCFELWCVYNLILFNSLDSFLFIDWKVDFEICIECKGVRIVILFLSWRLWSFYF